MRGAVPPLVALLVVRTALVLLQAIKAVLQLPDDDMDTTFGGQELSGAETLGGSMGGPSPACGGGQREVLVKFVGVV